VSEVDVAGADFDSIRRPRPELRPRGVEVRAAALVGIDQPLHGIDPELLPNPVIGRIDLRARPRNPELVRPPVTDRLRHPETDGVVDDAAAPEALALKDEHRDSLRELQAALLEVPAQVLDLVPWKRPWCAGRRRRCPALRNVVAVLDHRDVHSVLLHEPPRDDRASRSGSDDDHVVDVVGESILRSDPDFPRQERLGRNRRRLAARTIREDHVSEVGGRAVRRV
jgi:hypothetical protein